MKAFGNVHPFVLLVYFLSVLTVTMFAANPVLSLTALLGGILFCAMLVRRSRVPGDIGFYVPLFLLVAVTNPLFSHNGVTPLFFLNGNPVTLEALLYGFALAVAVVGVLLWCKGYSEVMTGDKFLYLFGSVIPRLALVLSMALRFVPQFRRQMRRVRCAQKTMGLYAARGYTDKVRSAGRVFLAMIAWSLEKQWRRRLHEGAGIRTGASNQFLSVPLYGAGWGTAGGLRRPDGRCCGRHGGGCDGI